MFGSALTRKGLLLALSVLSAAETYLEQYRDQYHFSPAKNWMNDPNGLLYHKGTYHLYFQYNPGGMTWGNISWGHATSRDLLHWSQQPIALEVRKDKDGNVEEYFYSGSAVVDTDNTSGFGTRANPPLVAVYTSDYGQNLTLPSGKTVITGQESQSIAYSLDDGMTWTTYDAENPVIHTPPEQYITTNSLQNFRDPFVFWYTPDQNWVMVVSLPNDHTLLIYTSKNLRDWTNVSSFGPANAVSGQWECPGIFPLPVDGDRKNVKWVVQVGSNPGGPNLGSGTQYFVGSFNGTAFTADADSVYAAVGVPPGSSIIEDWENTSHLSAPNAALNWTASGDFMGITPVTGEDTVSNVLDTYFGADTNTGTITSTAFKISEKFINFRIAGGYFPYNPTTYGTANDIETSLNLKVGGKVVHSATGQNAPTLAWQGWDVASFLDQTAVLEIADFNTGTEGWGHLIVGEIVFSESLAQDQQANWVDLGPDYYAAASYNGLPEYERVAVGWANNWAYGADIPTTPWRSSMSAMRRYSLATIDSKATLVQEPYSLDPIEHTIYTHTWDRLPGSQFNLPVTGKAMDVTLTFNVISTSSSPAAAGDSTIRFLVRSNADGSQATVIGYDASTQQIFVDRTNSGDVSFNSEFPGIYYASLIPTQGKVTLRVLLDWSLVEVFGGRGESVITAQIFPSDTNESMALLYTIDSFEDVSITIKKVASTWN